MPTDRSNISTPPNKGYIIGRDLHRPTLDELKSSAGRTVWGKVIPPYRQIDGRPDEGSHRDLVILCALGALQGLSAMAYHPVKRFADDESRVGSRPLGSRSH